jgi:hypothetical protein
MKHRLINTTRSMTLKAPALSGRDVGPPAARPAGVDPTKEGSPPMPALRGEAAIRHLEQTGRRDSLSAALAAARYKVKASEGGGYEASNPKQRLHATFTTSGARVASLKGGRELVLKPIGYGYGSGIIDLDSHNITARGNQIEYEYFFERQSAIPESQSAIREWFVNTKAGIEHGFTLPEPPPTERGEGDALRVEMEVEGDFEARLDAARQAVVFGCGRDGEGLTYDKLKVYDARGRELTARFELEGNRLAIVVEDGEAEYPLTIDPLLAGQTKVTHTDGAAGDYFGRSVAIDGDTAVVGAPFDDVAPNDDQGAAYVFVMSGGNWTEQQQLVADDGQVGDEFGASVAISGDTIVVGAPEVDLGAVEGQGAAYVFKWDGTVWTQEQKLMASDGQSKDHLGMSVAIDGDTAVVGANSANSNQGVAYVFTRSANAWTQQQKLVADDLTAKAQFGISVAINGAIVVVGAHGMDTDRGAAYVFTGNGATWTQQQKLIADDRADGDGFGFSVAISGDTVADTVVDTVVVGASFAGTGGNLFQGSAYVFTQSGTTWTQRKKLTAADGEAEALFGYSVGISGRKVVVGAIGATVDGNAGRGAAYVFVRSGPDWKQRKKLIASDGAANDFFGRAVAVSEDTMVSGAYADDINANQDQGSAYLFPIVTVNPPDPDLPEGTGGAEYNQTFTASGGTAPHTFALIAGSIPADLTLAEDGTLSGTLTAEGEFNFTIEATDFEGVTGASDYTMVVKPPLIVKPIDPNLPDGFVGQPYTATFLGQGGTQPYTFSISAGRLPLGMSLHPGGVLSGEPVIANTYTFTVRVTDDTGATGEREYTLVISQSRTT